MLSGVAVFLFVRIEYICYSMYGDSYFYKTYAYACLYQSDTNKVLEIKPEDISITFVCNHYPREMLKHLQKEKKLILEDFSNERTTGIYYLKGDIFAMQLIVVPQLSVEDNYWLQHLRNNLKADDDLKLLIENYEKHCFYPNYKAVMDVITRGNQQEMEASRMCEAMWEIVSKSEKYAQEQERAEERGKEEGQRQGILLTKQVFKLHLQGKTVEEIAKECEISEKEVKEILE